MNSFLHTYTVSLEAGQTELFNARGQKFLPIKCVDLGGNLQPFKAKLEPDGTFNPMAVGLLVKMKGEEFFDAISFNNPNGVLVQITFQVATLDIEDRRLIFNPAFPIPIVLANGSVTVIAAPPVNFNGIQPVTSRQLGMRYSTPNTVGIAAGGTAAWDYEPGTCGFIVQVFSVGKSITVQIDDAHPIMTIADTDGPVFVPLVGPINFKNNDVANAIVVSITQLLPTQ